MLSSEVIISREQSTKNLCHCPVCEKARASTEEDPNVDSAQLRPHPNGQDGSIQPSFDTLTIICHQIVERYPQPLSSVLHDDITPTRIEDGSLWIVLCHHVNGINVIESLRQGNVTSSMIECMFASFPSWGALGISRIEPIPVDARSETARMRFMSNALPPPGQYQSRSVLESMALDIEWATSAPDALMYRLCSTDISTTHSPEVSALFMGMRRTLECLARNHPLIFSPTSIQQFITFMTYNASLADSLCSICSRDSSPEKHTWEAIFQTIQTQFPNVPQHQRRLLIEHSLEMAAYRDIVRRMRGNHSLKGQLDTTLACFRQQDKEQSGVDRMLTFEDFAFEEVDDIDDDPCC